MQIEFLSSKENFLKLYAWVKDNICDLVVIDCKTKREFDESELYQAEVGYSKKICFTTREFAPLITEFCSKEYYKYSVELYIGYCPDDVYTMDFTGYNLQKAEDGNIPSRLYRDSFYSSDEETKVLKSIYNKIAGKIRRSSVYVADRYHLLLFNEV